MDRFSELSDAELLRLTASHPEAFGAFYRRHVHAVLAYARRRTPSPELALDLTAEVFAAALEGASAYRPKDVGAGPWLYGIARHKLADSSRRGRIEDRARQRLGMQPIEPTDAGLEQVEQLACSAELLSALPDDQRDAVHARVIEEQGYQEIAARLECSPQVVRKRVSRGLAALRARVEGET
jgi:RNA polymerase sigma factor (sigma-70 family)